LATTGAIIGQFKKYYSLQDGDFDKVQITLTATSNSCCIKPTVNPNLVNVFGYENNSSPQIFLVHQEMDRVENLIINLTESGKTKNASLPEKIFSSNNTVNDHWDLYLSKEKPMRLQLNYAIGDASVDLSDLPIEQLKITTGSADVNVSYLEGRYNLVQMDTFFVKVDLGSLTVKKMNYARARTVIADVNFGALILDYSRQVDISSQVYASVGAGNLIIGLPKDKDIPVIINIHNSPLCHVKLPREFRKKEKHVYVSESYREDINHVLSFNLDVAVGQIRFVDSQ
jgi:hypothetical protein